MMMSTNQQHILEMLATSTLLTGLLLVILREVVAARKEIRERQLRATLFETLNYKVECWWGSKKYAIPLSLVYVILLINLFGGIAYSVVTKSSLGDAMFTTWLMLSDPGAQGDIESAMGVSLCITVAGLIVFGFLISIITDFVADKVAHIKSGNSRIIEAGHTVILGHSSHLKSLILEVCLANESEGGGVIAILADLPIEVVQREIHSIPVDKLKNTKVVARRGSSLEWEHLKLVSVETARVTVVMANNDVSADESDAFTMRVTLVLSGFAKLSGHVVAEIRDLDNKERIELTSTPHRTECIVAHDLVGRLMIQCARFTGLTHVVESLLGFEGDECYIDEWPSLVGMTFAQVTRAFDLATPIGIKLDEGEVVINPQPADEWIVEPGDKIVVIAADNDSYRPLPGGPIPFDVDSPRSPTDLTPRREPTPFCHKALFGRWGSAPGERQHFLFLGWRRDMADMIHFLDDLCEPGSSLTIMSTLSVRQRQDEMAENGRSLDLKNLVLDQVIGNPVSRRQLQALPLRRFTAILILSEKSAETDVASKDSLTCASVVLVDDILKRREDDSFYDPVDITTLRVAPNQAAAAAAETTDDKARYVSAPPTPAVTPSPSQRRGYYFSSASTVDVDDDTNNDIPAFFGFGACFDTSTIFGGGSSSEKKKTTFAQPPLPPYRGRMTSAASIVEEDDDDDDDDRRAGAVVTHTPEGNHTVTKIRAPKSRVGRLPADDSSGPGHRHRRVRLNRDLSVMRDPRTAEPKAHDPTMICELLDSRMQRQLAQFCEIVASNNYVSRVLAMVSEGADINSVLWQLFGARSDTTLIIEPAVRHVAETEAINFLDLALRVQFAGNVLIGYLDYRDDAVQVELNPKDKLTPRTFEDRDMLVVIGTDKSALY